MRAVIIDDEAGSLLVLRRMLEQYCPQVTLIGEADGVDTGLQLIRNLRPDLLILDIEMRRGNAFDLLNQLEFHDFQVIFVTAFDNYAVKAFKYSAVDYLLKPLDIDDLLKAIDRAATASGGKAVIDQMRALLHNVNHLHSAQQKIAIPTLSGLEFVFVADILRMEAKGSYTKICLNNGDQVTATRNIKEYESILPETVFCRIHNSHIINLQKLQKYQKGRGGYVVMEDGTTIEVASRRREEFLARLLK